MKFRNVTFSEQSLLAKGLPQLPLPLDLDNEVADAICSVPDHFFYIPGYNKGVTWTPDSGGGVVTLKVTGHSWSEMVDKLDVTHTGSEGYQELLAGILRGDGNVKANLDTAQIVGNGTIDIRAGSFGVLRFFNYTSGSNPFVVACMVTKVNYKTVVEGKVEYDFDVSLSFDTNAATTYTRPS